MSLLSQVLVASSDLESRQRVTQILEQQGLDPICASSMAQCCEVLAGNHVGLVFCDRNLADGNYRDLLTMAACARAKGKVRIVLMSSVMDPGEQQLAKSAGLFAVIASPCRPTDVEWMAIQATRDERDHRSQVVGSG